MRSIIASGFAVFAAALFVPFAAADTTPFPASHSGDVFVIAHTVTTDGALSSSFAPGSTVVFRAYAVDGKTKQILVAKDVKYFYVTVPSQPNVKLAYDPKAPGASGQYSWTGKWTVPADYPTGMVNFRVLVRTVTKHLGSFVQVPVPSAQLTISKTPQVPAAGGPGPAAGASGKVTTALYADSVNGTRPAGAAPRPIGCTQTNVYKRGEQFVLRTWGFDLGTGDVLSIDNVTEAHFALAGVPNITLNWGSHGPAKVFFWANAWQIPADYPLGETVVHITFTLTTGKTATLDFPIVVIP
jgi:hypothetical protein